jgi:hypothetical protein
MLVFGRGGNHADPVIRFDSFSQVVGQQLGAASTYNSATSRNVKSEWGRCKCAHVFKQVTIALAVVNSVPMKATCLEYKSTNLR